MFKELRQKCKEKNMSIKERNSKYVNVAYLHTRFSDPDDMIAAYEKITQERPWRETLVEGFLRAFLLFQELSLEQSQEIAEKIFRIRSEDGKWRLLVQMLVEDLDKRTFSGVFSPDDSPEKVMRKLNRLLDIVSATQVEQTWQPIIFY